jgi:rSAM/selenodomain-associated transferase 2
MISVIIPTLNPGTGLGPTLGALSEGLMAGAIRELILVDGGSEEPIDVIAEEVGAVLIKTSPGRGRQLAEGCAAAKAPWLLVLHADTVLPAGWTETARRHIETGAQTAGVFRLRFDDASLAARLVAGWANLRTRLFGLPYGDQGLLISRRLYEEVGGYRRIPLMEDVALARALGRRRIQMLDQNVTTSAERYRRDGWLRRGTGNMLCLIRYLFGADPDRLARSYSPSPATPKRPDRQEVLE